MNWYKIAQLEDDFESPSSEEGAYHLQETPNPDGSSMLGAKGKFKELFLDSVKGTKNWLVRYQDDYGQIRARNVLSNNREDALQIFKDNIGINPIDIIPVSVGMGRMTQDFHHTNESLTKKELLQLEYIGISPERIEERKKEVKRPNAGWRAYIEEHFGESLEDTNFTTEQQREMDEVELDYLIGLKNRPYNQISDERLKRLQELKIKLGKL